MRRGLAVLLSLSIALPAGAAQKQGPSAPIAAPAAGAGIKSPVSPRGPSSPLPSSSVPKAAGAASAVSAAPAEAAAASVVQPASAAQPAEPAVAQAREAAAELAAAGEAASEAGSSSQAYENARRFDVRQPSVVTVAAGIGMHRLLGRFAPKAKPVPAAGLAYALDSFGGPQHEPMSLEGQARYGLKWGLHLTAISTLVATAVEAVGRFLPWHATFPYAAERLSWIPGVGSLFPALKAAAASRMELLIDHGPRQIAEAMAESPLKHLFYDMPKSVVVEELTYHAAIWGVAVLFPLIRHGWRALGGGLARLPAQLRGGLELPYEAVSLSFAEMSRFAFPAAALASAVMFGHAHFANWGLNAQAFFVPAAAGLALSYVVYKTRSLIPAIVAHFSYNALIAGTAFAAMVSPSLGTGYGLLVPAAAVSYLIYEVWKHQGRRAAAAGGRAWTALAAWTSKLAAAGGFLLAAVLLSAGPTPSASPGALTAAMPPVEQPYQIARAGAEGPLSTEEVVKRVKPAVVQILIRTAGGKTAGSGSGVIVTKEGLVITNNHVVGPVGIGGMVTVRFADGQSMPAVVVATSRRDDVDLAFLQLPENPMGWPTAPVGSTAKLPEGAAVIAMGYPYGFPFTVTRGVLSGKGGGRGGYDVQHDAAVNPGNSGGPAFNDRGEVIAINTAIYSKSGGFAGISLGRSAEATLMWLKQFERTGSISPGWLGVIVDRSHPMPGETGVLIEQVRPGSPAALAGLQAGDRVVRIDGQEVPAAPAGLMALGQLVLNKKVGDRVTILVERDGDTTALRVTLGEWLAKPGKLFSPVAPGAAPESPSAPRPEAPTPEPHQPEHE